jgi:hypothetical protein
MNKRIIYGALGFVALVGSMELSRTQVTAPVQSKTASTHVPTAAEQCAAVSAAIENCEAILSGKMTRTPSADNSKLNYGKIDPRTGDTSIMNPVVTGISDAERESNRLQLDVERAEYGVRVARRQLVGRFLGSNRMLAGTEVVKCPCEMRAWSLSTKVLL